MTDSELDPIIERIAFEARRPVAVDSDARERLLAVIRAETATDRASGAYATHRRSFAFSLSQVAALAAGLVGIGVLLGSFTRAGRDSQSPTGPSLTAAAPRLPASDTVVTFVFAAPAAAKVSVVGDFNQWNAESTPMTRIGNSGYWSVTVPMSVGRHLYSFLAVGSDGEHWSADPHAPTAPDDGFGRANSVVLVGKGSTS
jgi:hypothetical protein